MLLVPPLFYLSCSLFDNHTSPSFDANLDYMFRNFGFYFQDAEHLTDPEGLLKYLVCYSNTLMTCPHPRCYVQSRGGIA